MYIYILLVLISFIMVLIGVHVYIELAKKYKTLAYKNFRSLHDIPMLRGGGVVFSLVIILAILTLYLIDTNKMFAVCIGGTSAMLFGITDDIINIGKNPSLYSNRGWCWNPSLAYVHNLQMPDPSRTQFRNWLLCRQMTCKK
jgi:UDP-N-acetylmuramyl pentapeptide phosphotransferase/UDP-N-acetylglucosamine-1-phosphate transferase